MNKISIFYLRLFEATSGPLSFGASLGEVGDPIVARWIKGAIHRGTPHNKGGLSHNPFWLGSFTVGESRCYFLPFFPRSLMVGALGVWQG